MATTQTDLYPAAGLRVTAGDLTLSAITDDDLPGLVDLAEAGVHAPDRMPFLVPWTKAPAGELPRRFAAYHWSIRSAFAADDFHLDLAVRRGDELVGAQGFSARDYPLLRTAETGSWLGIAHQGQGIGTRMRQAVCALMFDHLGAAQITSGAFLDNPASLAVSRKVGYRVNGIDRIAREGAVAAHQNLLLQPEDLVRGEPVQVTGSESLQAFLGL